VLKFLDRREVNAVHQYLRGMQPAEPLLYRFVYESIVEQAASPAHAADYAYCFHQVELATKKRTITGIDMPNFEFGMTLSAPESRSR
jgi:hypothetical protein